MKKKNLKEYRVKAEGDYEYVAYGKDGLPIATSSKGWKDLGDQIGMTSAAILMDIKRNGETKFAKVYIGDDEDDLDEACSGKIKQSKKKMDEEYEDLDIDKMTSQEMLDLMFEVGVEADAILEDLLDAVDEETKKDVFRNYVEYIQWSYNRDR